jgi:serine/threonine-protein kinase PpkA
MADSPKRDKQSMSFRRSGRPTSAPEPDPQADDPAENDEPGVSYLCKRFECAQARSRQPFTLRGAELDDPVCPGCGKGDRLEEIGAVEAKKPGKKRLMPLLLCLLVGGGGAWWFFRQPNPVPPPPPPPVERPDLAITPESLEIVLTSRKPNDVFSIANKGKLLLAGKVSGGAPWLTVEPPDFGLIPGGSTSLKVSLTGNDVPNDGAVATLDMISNDPDKAALKLTVTYRKESDSPEPPPPPDDEVKFVWTRPAAVIMKEPASGGESVQDNVPAFSSYAVVEVRENGGERWYQVGEVSKTGGRGKSVGWMKEVDTLPQMHRLVANFTNHADRDKLVVFRNRGDLEKLVGSDPSSRSASYADLYQKGRRAFIENQGVPEGFPLCAVEPEVSPEVYETFYVMPILKAEMTRIDKDTAHIVELAGSSLSSKGRSTETVRNFDIVFVVDTSGTMQPFIDEVLNVIKGMADALADRAGQKGRFRFGFWGYQDQQQKQGIKYLTKNFTTSLLPAPEFTARLRTVSANVETPDEHPEAVLDGINDALNGTQWSPDAAPILILIGDAPPLPKAFRDGTDQAGIRKKLDSLRAAAVAIAIRNPKLPEFDRELTTNFASLSRNRGDIGGKWSYDIKGGASAFAKEFGSLAAAICVNIKKSVGDSTDGLPPVDPAYMQQVAARMKGLLADQESHRENKETPSFTSGWALSKGMATSGVKIFDVSVFVARSDLENLAAGLSGLLEKRKDKDAASFYREMQKLTEQIFFPLGSFDPKRLPFTSRLLETSFETLSEDEEDAAQFWNEVEAKISFMKSILHENNKRWGALHDNMPEGDYVTPYELEMVP